MHLKNTTDFTDRFIRRVVSFCCRHLELPVKKVRSITVRNKAYGYSGHCWVESGEIVISLEGKWSWSVNDAGKIVGKRAGSSIVYEPLPDVDAIEMLQIVEKKYHYRWVERLVRILAHELAHRKLYLDGSRSRKSRRYGKVSSGGSEQQTTWLENFVCKKFEERKVELIDEWSKASRKVETPAICATSSSRKQKNADKALKRLAHWERKLKIAKTKLKKYRAAVTRYRREGCYDAQS